MRWRLLDRVDEFEPWRRIRGSKAVTLEEYLHNFPDQAEGRRRFPTFDRNKDGVLSEEEFVKMGRL